MTKVEIRPSLAIAKDLLSGDPEGLRILVQTIVQEVLEAEMTDALGAATGERSAERRGAVIGQDTTRGLSRRGLARSSCACRRIAMGASRGNYTRSPNH